MVEKRDRRSRGGTCYVWEGYARLGRNCALKVRCSQLTDEFSDMRLNHRQANLHSQGRNSPACQRSCRPCSGAHQTRLARCVLYRRTERCQQLVWFPGRFWLSQNQDLNRLSGTQTHNDNTPL